MKSSILAIAALAMMASPVMAQTADPSGTSATGSAQAANNVSVVAGSFGPSDAKVKYSGHTWTTPNVQGGYFAGANGCLVGKSAGIAGGPIGLSFGSGKNDEDCNRRNDAGAWFTMGLPAVAVARMCDDEANANAFFAATHYACPGTNGDGRYKYSDGTIAPEYSFAPSPNIPATKVAAQK